MAEPDMPDAPASVPEQMQGITEQDVLDWRHHPVTRVIRQYLADYRDALRRDHVLRWENNRSLNPDYEAEARGRVLSIGETIDLSFADMTDFYQEPPDQKESP